jgi:phosphoribosylanthranilate isomerase
VRVPAVKICGLMRPEDARAAAGAGADYLGAILTPGFARSIRPVEAARFVQTGGPPLVAVLVDATLTGAVEAATEAGARLIQLHGEEPPELLEALRAAGDWRLWKAVKVRSRGDAERALQRYGAVADGLLLDGWHHGRGGGEGVGFPWDVVAPVRASFPLGLTFIAAGGLQPGNVADAVRRLDPDVVDVSSGVEVRRGVKDPDRMIAFVRNARAHRGS